MSNPQETTCVEVRRDGAPCRARALPEGDYCWAHAPEMAEKRNAARQAGGINSSGPARLRRMVPNRLNPIARVLEKALVEVHDGKLEPRRALAMAGIARSLVTVLGSGELEERLQRVEKVLMTHEERVS